MDEKILAIDPGPEVSGVVGFQTSSRKLIRSLPAEENSVVAEVFLPAVKGRYDILAIEMIASYGMPVGAETFETVMWIGRFREIFGWDRTLLVYRKDVKLFLCGDTRAKDSNVRQALLDSFPRTGGGATPQIGTRKAPGPLYGLRKHAVSALAVAVTAAHS